MNIQLDDCGKHLNFAPLSLTRPIGNLRIGIFTNDERWKRFLPEAEIGYITERHLSGKFPNVDGMAVNGSVIPNSDFVGAIMELEDNAGLYDGERWLAGNRNPEKKMLYFGRPVVILENRWDIFESNGEVLKADFELITEGEMMRQLSSTNMVIGDANRVFIEEGAIVEASILNTNEGPIYIGKNAQIMEGSVLRGPIALCENATVKMGAKIYGPTTIGPHCKVGGEVNNVLFQGYSNKGHDGFLGNSLIGEWCNLGADTNSSNLKNDYGFVKAYDYNSKAVLQTEVQFMGLTMGDHSKCAINTMFNTGTVVGVSCNIFGAEFPPKYVPSFSWGLEGDRFEFDRAIKSANNMMERRGMELSTDEITILKHIADID